ncbi:hypothetical protein E1B28_001350 [Marasmius oreades]|uniref:RING-type domain-containing protein n=1 Tax=Marasmius oreades TaxID=181124 RepID=A0A9P7V371_9AGAR|nr:uncharacterized protein E1B28_001350 [Marasmius oreades]KAG7099504.1 hypothetical protein E1B28_001350 [Marasmius oreades]
MPLLDDCTSEVEDEFDRISDDIDYTAINEHEWDIYESQAPPPSIPVLSRSNSTSYSDDDDYGNQDEQFFAELDELERKERETKSESHTSLTNFEEELCCPICFELVVYAHAVNPCGHTLCGSCGASWFLDNKKSSCPMCRSQAEPHRPMIPNVAVDGIVRKYINMNMNMMDDDEKLQKDFNAREWKWKLNERRVKDEFERRSRILSAPTFEGPLTWWMRVNRDQ